MQVVVAVDHIHIVVQRHLLQEDKVEVETVLIKAQEILERQILVEVELDLTMHTLLVMEELVDLVLLYFVIQIFIQYLDYQAQPHQ